MSHSLQIRAAARPPLTMGARAALLSGTSAAPDPAPAEQEVSARPTADAPAMVSIIFLREDFISCP